MFCGLFFTALLLWFPKKSLIYHWIWNFSFTFALLWKLHCSWFDCTNLATNFILRWLGKPHHHHQLYDVWGSWCTWTVCITMMRWWPDGWKLLINFNNRIIPMINWLLDILLQIRRFFAPSSLLFLRNYFSDEMAAILLLWCMQSEAEDHNSSSVQSSDGRYDLWLVSHRIPFHIRVLNQISIFNSIHHT